MGFLKEQTVDREGQTGSSFQISDWDEPGKESSKRGGDFCADSAHTDCTGSTAALP